MRAKAVRDLPEPLSPTMASVLPLPISNEMLLTAVKGRSPPKVMLNSFTESTGSLLKAEVFYGEPVVDQLLEGIDAYLQVQAYVICCYGQVAIGGLDPFGYHGLI